MLRAAFLFDLAQPSPTVLATMPPEGASCRSNGYIYCKCPFQNSTKNSLEMKSMSGRQRSFVEDALAFFAFQHPVGA